jgi:hypothetical protein
VLGLPAAAAAQTIDRPVDAESPSSRPMDPPDTGTTPDPGAPTTPVDAPTTVVGGGRTDIANVTFTLDLGATTLVGDPTVVGGARGTIRFDQDVQGPGRSRSGIIAQVRCASVSGKQATVIGQVTRGTGVFDDARSITLFIEDNGQTVAGRPPVDRFSSDVSEVDVPATCPPAPTAAPVDLGVSISEGDFVVSTATPATTPKPETTDPGTTTTPGTDSDTPGSSTPSGGGGAVSGP